MSRVRAIRFLHVPGDLIVVASLAIAACRSTPHSTDGTLALETHRFT